MSEEPIIILLLLLLISWGVSLSNDVQYPRKVPMSYTTAYTPEDLEEE
jgi:hypothetical protein